MKAVLLDVDGTLLRSNEAHALAWSRALGEFGYDVPPETVRRWIGMGGDKVLRRVDESLSDDHGPGKAISARRQDIFLHECVATLRPTNGARALLERLGAEKLQRVVATSAKKGELAALLDAAGIADQVDAATTSDDAERSKPDPDIVNEALKKASCAPEEAVYLGDTPYDVAAAHRAGVAAVALTCGGWDRSDLVDAEAVYEDPADLLRGLDTAPLTSLRRPPRETRT